MRNKCSSGAGEQQHEEKEGEENDKSSGVGAAVLNTSERCPICLNILTPEVGFPEHCCHAFCVSCILKWSETSNSCPVDRKTFKAVYKIDRLGGCTKIQVMEKCPVEDLHCSCDPYCMKCKTNFRMEVNPDSTSENINILKKYKCRNNEDNSEVEPKNLHWQKLCYTGDLLATCPFVLSEIEAPYVNSAEVEDESEICLMQRKREGMKPLMFSTAVENIECDSISTETLLQPPLSLDEYIFTRSPFSIRNKGFSKRTCVHSSAQDGTEKKQAASGASNSRGTKKKPVQSSTRRRSTRNSKSDVSQLQSSPKSSGSDQETLGCNTTSTKASGKPPSKSRKGAPKKGSRVRKRLRSAAHSQEESNDSKENSEIELEQEEKKSKMTDEDLSETEECETNILFPKNAEKGQIGDHSPYSSALEHSDDQHVTVSSSMQNMKCVDKEISPTPNLQTKHECDREDISSSPFLKNGQPTLGESQPDSLPSVLDNVEMAKEHLDSEEQHTLESGNLHDFEGENSSSSQASTKSKDSDNTDLSLLSAGRVKPFHDQESTCLPESETEFGQQKGASPLFEDFQDANKHDCSDTRQMNLDQESSDVSSSPRLEHTPPRLEEMSCKPKVSTVSPTVNSDKECEMELSPPCLDSFKEPSSEAQTINEMQIIKPPVPFGKFDQGHDDQANGLEVNLQSNKPKECIEEKAIKTLNPCESKHEFSPDISIIATEHIDKCPDLINVSVSEEFCTVLENDTKKSLPEQREEVDESKIPVAEDNNETLNVKIEPQKAFCEDNIESVAMDCDSVCSDHNESEIEQSTENNLTIKPEADSLGPTNSEILPAPPKGLPLTGDLSKKENRTRKSRFHSPSITWSPSKSDMKERQRSRSPAKVRESPVKLRDRSREKSQGRSGDRSRGRSRDRSRGRSRDRSRDKEGDRNHGGQRKGRSKDRHHRQQSRSRSQSSSRSGSRTRHRNRSSTNDRSEKECNSPPWKERRSNENWKSPRGSERYRRNEHEKTNEHFRNEKYDTRDTDEKYAESKSDYPEWVVEKMKSTEDKGDGWIRGDGRGMGDRGWADARGRGDGRGRGENRARGDRRGDFRGRGGDRARGNRGRGSPRGSWDDQYNSGDSWNRSVNTDWNSPRGHGGRGRGAFRGGFGYGDQNENNWNNRPSYSGNSNAPGQDSSRFLEHKNYKPKHEESFEPPADRSGWSSASSWAVRKTLPADVQNYYSKRGRNSTGSQPAWPRQEESQDQDQAPKEPPSQQTESVPLPVNMVPPPMNVVQQPMNAPPQPMNMFPYPVGVHPPIVNIQHNPYNLHPPLPIHLHPALPLVQVSAPTNVPQGLPPPPPPPPPSQQVNYIVPQQDGKPVQGNPSASHVSNNLSAPLLPAPTAAQGIVGTVLGPSSGSVVTSSHSKNSHVSVKSAARKESITVEASADSSKKEKKIQIQERAAHEVKVAIKQYYQNKDITKEEYKEIVKKAVDKVCHSKSGEVDSAKVANLVKAYVDKYKHNRKKGTEDKL